jgi:hypothetical protein
VGKLSAGMIRFFLEVFGFVFKGKRLKAFLNLLKFLEFFNVFFKISLVHATQYIVRFGIKIVGLVPFELKCLDSIFKLLNVLIKIGFFGFVASESVFEELLLVHFLLISISDVILELKVILMNAFFK